MTVFDISVGIGSLPCNEHQSSECESHSFFGNCMNKSYGIDIITNAIINNKIK